MSELTRRNFVAGACVAGAAALTATNSLIGSAKAAEEPETWDEECDVLILGAGGTGLSAACAAAEAGAKASEQFVSKFGRARSYKEQTIGTPDAGAVSTSLFIRGLAQGV